MKNDLTKIYKGFLIEIACFGIKIGIGISGFVIASYFIIRSML